MFRKYPHCLFTSLLHKKKIFYDIFMISFNVENDPTPTTTILVVLLTKGEIYKHICISIYKTVHHSNRFPICKNPLLMLSKGFLFIIGNSTLINHHNECYRNLFKKHIRDIMV
jgi:hypothetical protein